MGRNTEQWLRTAVAQLRCRRAVPGVTQELESHLNEQYNAFLRQGCTPEEADERTAQSMGDPVLAGGALDSVHRPRPARGPLVAVTALLFAGALLQCLFRMEQGVGFWSASNLREWAAAALGAAVLAAVYLGFDISLLARWAGRLYIGLMLISVCGLFWLGGYAVNGRHIWMLPLSVQYGAPQFSMLFIPIYAAVVYWQRGRGWRGLLTSGLALLPGLWLCLATPHFAAAAMLGIAGLAVCLVCCAQDWYGLGRRKSFAVVLGTAVLAPAVLLAGLAWADPGFWQRFLTRIAQIFRPALDDAGSGFWSNAVRRMWDGMQWFGPGDGSLSLSAQSALGTVDEFVQTAARQLCTDFLPAYVGWQYGIACAVVLMGAVAGALIWLWRTGLRIRSGLGRLCAVGCCTLLSAHAILCLLAGLGWSSVSGMLPFLDSGWNNVLHAVLAGVLLSAFRLDDVLHDPPVPASGPVPSAAMHAGRVAYSDGVLQIRLRPEAARAEKRPAERQ